MYKKMRSSAKRFLCRYLLLTVLPLAALISGCDLAITSPRTAFDDEAPSAPANIRTSEVLSDRVSLLWEAATDNTGVSGYRVYRDGDHVGTTSGTSYSDITVDPASGYTYTVAAFDAAGNESGQSEGIDVATPPDVPDYDAPTVPANLRTTVLLSCRAGLSWDASSDNAIVAGYRVYRDGITLGSTTGTTYSDTSVSAGNTYRYTVSAYDASGNESAQSAGLDVTTPSSSSEPTILDHRTTDASLIPDEFINAAKNTLHIAYQHTSHGSQIISGMNALESYPGFGTRYQWSDDGSSGLDLDDYGIPGCADLSQGDSVNGNGDTPWVVATRTLLDNPANNHINVVMWSWCSINNHNISRYITNMEKLIAEYGPGGSKPRAAAHPVEFVFMTGHSEGSGEEGFVAQAAAQIRAHCVENNRWLIDYYDIECHDPDGNYFGDDNVHDNLTYNRTASDDGNWATEYIALHDGSILDILTMGNGAGYNGCTSCAHSDSPRAATLNCVLKGQAAWWLFARMAGWDGN